MVPFQVVKVLETKLKGLDYEYYSVHVTPVDYEKVKGGVGSAIDSSHSQEPAAYLKAGHLMQLDASTCTQGPWAPLFGKS